MKEKFGLKYLIIITAVYLLLFVIKKAIAGFTGMNWTSPQDFNNVLGLIAIGLLWGWYFTDRIRRK